ncbi:MAG: hypothetical protein KK482_24225 [Sinorhizobium meliloti]|uniref:hypothetical protein n=1 Tax=Ensifer sesbaniae TaxID=1214071 RepID=UPI0015683E4B|nr:hypothetical protein [Ensifer sesbaniae]MCG5486767.1 hypothetical protein [Sinorhizobium meliloti]
MQSFVPSSELAKRAGGKNSYRDTLMLLLPFASNHAARAIDRMSVEDLTASIIRQFIDHLSEGQTEGQTKAFRSGLRSQLW